MAQVACVEAMDLLSMVFSSGIIGNDGHEILARLQVGDDPAEIMSDLGDKFDRSEQGRALQEVARNWPPLHLEMLAGVVQWALGKLDTDDRVMIEWKGDAEYPETVTKFELRDHTLRIEFAHPPVGSQATQVAS